MRSEDKKQILEEGTAFQPQYGPDGLILALAVDRADGTVLMAAWMNEEALRATLATGFAHYWSRSRQSLWKKGDTSGQLQKIHEIRVDCDQDALILVVDQAGGGACHTGRKSCFYRRLTADGRSLIALE